MERNYKSNILKYYIFSFILGIHTVRAVYTPYMIIWGGVTFFQMMLLQSYFTAMIVILEIPSGAIADYLGRKTALVLSALSIAIAAYTYSSIPNFYIFILAETFWALGVSLMSGTNQAFLYISLKSYGEEDSLSKTFGRVQSLNLIALTISAPIGSIIAEFVSLQFTMRCLAFIYTIAFIFSFTFKEPKSVDNGYRRENYFDIIKSGFKELKNNKILRTLALDWIPISVLIMFLFWTYQVYFETIHIPILFFGFILIFMNLTNVIFTNIIPKWLKHSSNKKKFLIGINLINGFAYLLLGITTFIPLGLAIILIIVAFGFTRYLIFINGINSQIDSENRATVLSTINMFSSLIRAILYPFIGILVELNVFFVFIITGILILFLSIFTRSKNEYF